MHIPDGFLDAKTWTTAAAASTVTISYAASRAKDKLGDLSIPTMGVLGAFIFVAQMVNFPIAAGTSGHFLGAAAAAILLGPWVAAVLMTTVLIAQALFLGDGGVLALGANVMNVAVLGTLAAYLVYRALRRVGRGPAAFVAAWCSAVIPAVAVALELGASGVLPLRLGLPALVGWNALLGVAEGVMTVSLVGYLHKVVPQLGRSPSEDVRAGGPTASPGWTSGRLSLIVPVFVVLAFMMLIGPFSSALPDTLWRVAKDTGIERLASDGPRMGMARELSRAAGGATAVALALFGAAVAYGRRRKRAQTAQRGERAPAAAHPERGHGHPHPHTHEDEIHLHAHVHERLVHEHPHFHSEDSLEHLHSHAYGFETFSHGLSPLHRLDARAKTIGAMGVVVLIISSPHLLRLALWLCVGVYGFVLAGVPLRYALKRSLVAVPFAAVAAMAVPFVTAGPPVGGLGPLVVTSTGLLSFAMLVLKAWLSVLTVALLLASTSFADLAEGFGRLGAPKLVVALLSFLYRFVWLTLEEFKRTRRAWEARGLGRGALRRLEVAGAVVGSLLSRSFARAERVHASMMGRGFTGALPSMRRSVLSYREAVFAVCLMSLAIAITVGVG